MKSVKHADSEPAVVSRIVELLVAQGKEQQDLTSFLGIHRNSMTEWKAGRSRSYRTHINEIAEFLGVSPTFLLRGVDDQAEGCSELVKKYNMMNSKQRKQLLDQADAILNEP